ncbi:MAG: radical SAM family heme chaperone HemW [Eubacteriales bacterium]|nr:radical SAM family heme chaperone HemW [Eubacteriales bacterium]
MRSEKQLELYIHIPFCIRKCRYCDFLSFAVRGKDSGDAAMLYDRYFSALKKEITGFDGEGCEIRSVFFGGGTPSAVPAEYLAEVLQLIREKFVLAEDAEISMEANPGTLDEEKLHIYKEAGISRLSLGLQSVHNEELSLLGRIHTWEEFLDTYQKVRTAGFTNVNVDLMSALPGQSAASWEESLRRIAALSPEHISAYSLIIEEGTPFYEEYHEDARLREEGEQPKLLPSEEVEREMYALTEKILAEYGYHRYEISNYAKEGRECRHNLGYWKRIPYRGFGLGASSLIKEYRFANTESLEAYLKDPLQTGETEELTREDQIEETLMLGLRLTAGISKKEFITEFGIDINDRYGAVIQRFCAENLLESTQETLKLTEKGLDFADYIILSLIQS